MTHITAKYRPVSKSQLEKALNVCTSTLQYYLNTLYYTDLAALGYRKSCKVLNPQCVRFLCDKLCIEVEEFKT